MTELALISTNSRALSANTNQRTIPSNTEAEQALLGALLVNNSVYEKVGETLSGRHFFDPVHGRIYDAIATLIDRGQIADTKTLKGLFDNDPALTELGGSNYLVMLAANVVSIFNVEDYANLIHELYLRRQLIGIGTDVVNDAFSYDLEQKASTQIEEAEAKLFDLAETGDTSRGFLSLKEAVKLSIETANEAYKRDSHITGVTTGLRDLDTKLGGLQKSDLIIVAGRPGMGKTALATNIA
ncbi:MAG: replicative DNA helicase, partial [Alphaproteobacteria bacterium]|nr:replicative DNA helicase [Alphaproteobacteria bacterium]